MGLGNRVSSVVAFLRAGYPATVSPLGHAPLLALLPRRVSDAEVVSIATELLAAQRPTDARADIDRADIDRAGIDRADIDRAGIDRADIGVAITRVTDEMPLLDDIQRVRSHLAGAAEPGR